MAIRRLSVNLCLLWGSFYPIVVIVASLAITSASVRSSAHSDGCSRNGDIPGINCQLLAWVHCTGGAVRATSFNANDPRYCPNVKHPKGFIVAVKRPVCGARITVTNAKNGRSVEAVVGDKGPGTIAVIDLSYQTAAAIGFPYDGHASGCVYIGSGFKEAEQ